MKLKILGTGNGAALKCYNTCFAIENNNEYFLIDGGGGNEILKQLEKSNIDIHDIHNIFISHTHTDHIMGIVWVVRRICEKIIFKKTYQGNLNIYGDKTTLDTFKTIISLLFPKINNIKDRICYKEIVDMETLNIIGLDIKFFDILPKKEAQFGFIIGDKLAFCGDEPLNKKLIDLVKNKTWFMHEGFCLDKEEFERNAHAAGHSTVKETAEIAKLTNAKNLIILHTEDDHLPNRKQLFKSEAKKYFSGNIFVPDDLEEINID